MNKENLQKETLCIKGGYNGETLNSVTLPIVQSTSYRFDSAEQVANLFDLKENGHIYSRISNPTVAALEEKLTALEDGVGAVCVSSGQSAVLLAVLNICKSGDHVVSVSSVYGGTFNLFNITLRNFGIETTFVDPYDSEDEILSKIQDNTKLIFGETIGNPSLNIFDFEKFSKIAKISNIPLIIDNTTATPYLFNPFKYGANIVVHSTSKYIDGHSVALGGVIIDGGNFNWENRKFNELTEPDPSYHGLKYVETFKNSAYIVKLRVTLLRDLGNAISPNNAFLTNLGLETLHLRMDRHSKNALALAKFLQTHKNVEWVNYPLLECNKDYKIAKEYLPKGASGILTFGVKGGVKSARKLISSLKLIPLVVHLGDVRTTLIHPASTTHRQLSKEELKISGVSEDLVRVSVGIENIDDIICDFKQALNKVGY